MVLLTLSSEEGFPRSWDPGLYDVAMFNRTGVCEQAESSNDAVGGRTLLGDAPSNKLSSRSLHPTYWQSLTRSSWQKQKHKLQTPSVSLTKHGNGKGSLKLRQQVKN